MGCRQARLGRPKLHQEVRALLPTSPTLRRLWGINGGCSEPASVLCSLVAVPLGASSRIRLASRPHNCTRLIEFDRDNLPERVVRQLQRVMADPNFTPEQVGVGSAAIWWSLGWSEGSGSQILAGVAELLDPTPNLHPCKLPTGRQAVQGSHEHLLLGSRHGHLRGCLQDGRAQAAGTCRSPGARAV